MKYIITESKINKLVSMYLDNQNLETSDIGNGEFNISDGKHGNDVIRYEIDHSLTYPEKYYHSILISDDLVTKITQLFGLKSEDSINSIINWFNQEYDLNVDIHNFEWLWSDDDYYDDDYYDDEDEEYYD